MIKYDLALITGYGEIFCLAPNVKITPTPLAELHLQWEGNGDESIKARLPLRVPADQDLFGNGPDAPSTRRANKKARDNRSRDDDLLVAFKAFMTGLIPTLGRKKDIPPDAIGVRKRQGERWSNYIFAEHFRARFPIYPERNRLTFLLREQGVLKAGRQSDTLTREVVINGKKHTAYRISMTAFRKL